MPTLTLGEIVKEYNHIKDDRRKEILAAVITNVALAIIAVILRLVSRRIIKAKVQADDWLIIAALALAIAQGMLLVHGVTIGFGRHIVLLKHPSLFAKLVITSEILYLVGCAVLKMSVFFLYRRIFGNIRYFNATLLALGVFVWMYIITALLTVIFQCRPINAAWNFTITGNCIDLGLAAMIVGIINCVVDVITLCLPIPLVWRLQMKLKWRLQVIFLFALGGFICAGSIWRVTTVHKLKLLDATCKYFALLSLSLTNLA